MYNAIASFVDEIRSAGLTPPGEVIADGKIHRFSSNGKPSDTAGWYVLHQDGIAAGAFGCWRAAVSESWCERSEESMSPADRDFQRRRMAEISRQREEERIRAQEAARERAEEIWSQASPASDDHPYLLAKGVRSYGLRLHHGALVIPLRDSQKTLRSLQFIEVDGRKQFLAGGRVVGGYYSIGRPNGLIAIAEGYATSATIHEVTGLAVAVACNAGNLPVVAKAIRERYPDWGIIVCADDDVERAGNPGMTKARIAAEAVHGMLAVPDFERDRPAGATDFNDLRRILGDSAVIKALAQAALVVAAPSVIPTDPATGDLPVPAALPATSATWPIPQPLPTTLPPVAAFVLELLPQRFRRFAEDVADRMQCPLEFVAVPLMVMIGSVIGRKVGIRPKRHDTWWVPCNLWGLLVGRPGMMKSPPIAAAKTFIDSLEIAAGERYQMEMMEHKARKMVNEEDEKEHRKRIVQAIRKGGDVSALRSAMPDDEEEPVRRRYITNDPTIEKLGDILSKNPNGLLVFRDELAGLLVSLDMPGREASRSFFIESWNGNSRYTVDRIGRGTVEIEALCLSVIGSVQPGPIGSYVLAASTGAKGDDGLIQRFQLAVWPDLPKVWINVDRPADRDAEQEVIEVFRSLDEMTFEEMSAHQEGTSQPWLRFDDEAQTIFDQWRENLEGRLRNDDLHPAMESHLAKYRSLVPKLAVICQLVDEPRRGSVGAESLLRACAWGQYLETHANRLYAQAISPEVSAAIELNRHIRAGKLPEGFTARDAYMKGWSGLDAKTTVAALHILEDLDHVRGEPTFGAGRPTVRYRVNPALRAETGS